LARVAARYPTAAESGVMVGAPPSPEARVTLENWQRAPFNRWAFLHTRELIPSANISRGEGEVWQLERSDAGLESLDVGESTDGPLTLGAFLDNSWTDGMLVLQRGEIKLEAYRNAMTSTTRHLAMSVSKSITSLLIGILVERGAIDIAAYATTYVPELAGSAFEGATVQHLLDMQVANAWREDYMGPESEYWRLDVAAGWQPPRQGAALTLLDFFKETHADGRHGERFQYSSPNTDLLGLIIERVSGKRFAIVAAELLWQPAGMEFDADITLDPAGTAAVDGGFCIALRDFGRIGQLFLNGGSSPGREIVPTRWIEESRRPNPARFDPATYGADQPGASYHNQWWSMDGRSLALGIHGQMIAVDVEASLVVVFTTSAPEPDHREQRLMQRRIVGALAKALG
jgi:CubicO group peptidase (beta-lactamase class C family)